MTTAAVQQLVVKDLPLCQFPSKPVSLAYGSAQKLLAIGCENGKILILDGKTKYYIEHEEVHLMLFITWKSKDYLLTSSKKNKTICLWFEEQRILKHDLNHTPTVLTWLPAHSTYLVGTKRGTVKIAEVKELPNDKITIQASESIRIIENCTCAPGEVVAFVERPRGKTDPLNNFILVVFSSGLCAIWDWKGKCTQTENADVKVDANPLYAWWSDETNCYVAYDNGTIWAYEYKDQNLVKKECYTLGGHKDGTPIRKFQCVPVPSTRPWLVYTGGSSSVPDGCKDSHIVSSFKFPDSDMPILPFNDAVVDILCLPLQKEPPVIAVLTESELVMLHLNDSAAKEIEFGSSKIIRYPRFMNFHEYSHITSQVTSLQHCGDCSKELLKAIITQGTSTRTPELIVTGHKNGTVCLWLYYYAEAKDVTSFKLPLVIYTSQYFEAGDQKQLSITLTKMTASQQCLLVVNSGGHMLLYRLHSCLSSIKPQSQEIILKDYQDDTQSQFVQTPSPRFRPCLWQSRVQLLQHFSCHYQKERSKQPMPVTITSADYNEKMEMLAVGTDKGLIVLDTCENSLIQVIGSEKKLLRLSGCVDLSSKSSESDCKVTELQIVTVNIPNKQPEITLWAGTAGGSLGALGVTREKGSGKVLKLRETGKGKQTNSSVVGIHFLKQTVDSASKVTSNSDSTIVVVTTQDIQIFSYQKAEQVSTCKSTEAVLRSGLVCAESDAQYVITLTNKKELVTYLILDLLYKPTLTYKLKNSDAALLSGCGGSHAVIYSDKKLQLTSIPKQGN